MTQQVTTTLPEEFVERLKAICGPEDFESVFATFHKHRPCGYYANRLVAEDRDTIKRLEAEGIKSRPVDGLRHGYLVDHEHCRKLAKHKAVNEGCIFVQNPTNLIPATVLRPRPGEKVLDLTAAPGGKSLQMSGLMHNRGKISAIEMVRARYYRLEQNLERGRVDNVTCYLTDARRVGKKAQNWFDRVLLDAPCTSEASFSIFDSNSYSNWSQKRIIESAANLKVLLKAGLNTMRKGGACVYCTSTFAPEENEGVLQFILDHAQGAIALESIEVPAGKVRKGMLEWKGQTFDPQMERAVRILPDDSFNGLFVCKLRKKRI